MQKIDSRTHILSKHARCANIDTCVMQNIPFNLIFSTCVNKYSSKLAKRNWNMSLIRETNLWKYYKCLLILTVSHSSFIVYDS